MLHADRGEHWGRGMDGDAGEMVAAAVVGVVVLLAAIWLVRRFLARRAGTGLTAPAAPAVVRPTPEEILAERLARSEIEPDDFRTRLAVLRESSLATSTPPGSPAD